ncbi:hypothetical protein [Kosmotoga sp. DU53]|uniref:hypothetical protein n=1 Tax=Kosmotoga sp. DU53 TaxID=1310160 RepID=UPI0007C4AC8E|nr:hypothetical protein [Kosmotoga sp. DU53]OAA23055.1 hypothetical protein DU53_03300 [Kosmotoga sp. DU53]
MWYRATDIAKEIGTNAKCVGKILSSVKVKADDREYNLGLKIKSTSRDVMNPQFVKKVGNTWFYTEEVLNLVKEYAAKFPGIVKAIEKSDNAYIDYPDYQEIKRCYEWVKTFRDSTYKRIDVKTGKDYTGIK